MEISLKSIFAITLLIFLSAAHDMPLIKKSNFDTLVKSSNEVWILKIAHPQCGSCNEFNPIFHRISHNNPSYKYGITYIDDNDGMDLATSLGSVMDNGLPGVIMFNNVDGTFIPLVTGSVDSEVKVTKKMKDHSKNLQIKDGFYIKLGVKSDL